MTTKEFSDLFDVLYNNITSNQAPGLDEYEKSVFLTKAQEEIVKNYFNPKGNAKQEGFDDTPKRQADFSTIISEMDLTPYSPSTGEYSFEKRQSTKRFIYPVKDIFLILNELVYSGDTTYVVVPISYIDYDRVMAKPYKFPPKYLAWRLITNKTVISKDESLISVAGKDYFTLNIDSLGAELKFEITNYNELQVILLLLMDTEVTLSINVEDFQYGNTKIIKVHCPIENSFPEIKEAWDDIYKDRLNIELSLPTLTVSISLFYAMPTESTTYEIHTFEVNKKETKVIQLSSENNVVVALIGKFEDETAVNYSIRYVKKPKPIILANLGEDEGSRLKINGEYKTSECELPEQLHDEILQRAVELAKIAWAGTQEEIAATNMHVTSGQRSE